MSNLKVIIALGRIAHFATIKAIKKEKISFKFSHSNRHIIGKYILFDSYHCSRYNINTKRLTKYMFKKVLLSAAKEANLL